MSAHLELAPDSVALHCFLSLDQPSHKWLLFPSWHIFGHQVNASSLETYLHNVVTEIQSCSRSKTWEPVPCSTFWWQLSKPALLWHFPGVQNRTEMGLVAIPKMPPTWVPPHGPDWFIVQSCFLLTHFALLQQRSHLIRIIRG